MHVAVCECDGHAFTGARSSCGEKFWRMMSFSVVCRTCFSVVDAITLGFVPKDWHGRVARTWGDDNEYDHQHYAGDDT